MLSCYSCPFALVDRRQDNRPVLEKTLHGQLIARMYCTLKARELAAQGLDPIGAVIDALPVARTNDAYRHNPEAKPEDDNAIVSRAYRAWLERHETSLELQHQAQYCELRRKAQVIKVQRGF